MHILWILRAQEIHSFLLTDKNTLVHQSLKIDKKTAYSVYSFDKYSTMGAIWRNLIVSKTYVKTQLTFKVSTTGK